MSTGCIDPKSNTLSPENPRRWALISSSFSLLMPILSKANAKMMSVELPLSTKTLCTVFLATTALLPADRYEDAGSFPYRSPKKLWWCLAVGVWILLVFPASPLFRCCTDEPCGPSWTLLPHKSFGDHMDFPQGLLVSSWC